MINLVCPMSGLGNRFFQAGYTIAKPFIDILGKSMIERVVNSINIDGRYIFIAQREHLEKYNGYEILNKIAKNNIIIPLDKQTDGAVRTCLFAEKYINNSDQLIIFNSDQILRFSRADFLLKTSYTDGCLLTFDAQDPKWSYVKTNKEQVLEVAEKKVISNQANCGLYSWAEGKDFVWSANRLIADDIRTNNEFYIAETYNILIKKGHYITAHKTIEMMPCGTPDDLENTIKIIKERE